MIRSYMAPSGSMHSIPRVSSILLILLAGKIQIESLMGEHTARKAFPPSRQATTGSNPSKRGFCVEVGDGIQLTREGQACLPVVALRAIAQRLHAKSTRPNTNK